MGRFPHDAIAKRRRQIYSVEEQSAEIKPSGAKRIRLGDAKVLAVRDFKTSEGQMLTPKRGALPTARNILAGASPY